MTKVELGEADAGIVMVTDVAAGGALIEGVAIPEDQNILCTYPIAVLKGRPNEQAAQAFVDYVRSPKGQSTLCSLGFLPPETR